MSVRTKLAALAIAGLSLAGGAAAAAGVLAAAAPPAAAVLTSTVAPPAGVHGGPAGRHGRAPGDPHVHGGAPGGVHGGPAGLTRDQQASEGPAAGEVRRGPSQAIRNSQEQRGSDLSQGDGFARRQPETSHLIAAPSRPRTPGRHLSSHTRASCRGLPAGSP